MTARRMDDRRKLSPEDRKDAYNHRFKATPALPPDFELPRTPREPPKMVGGAEINNKNPEDITPRDLVTHARKNSLPILQRLYEIAMMDPEDPRAMPTIVEACCQFLNRAGLYEVKGQVAAIYAKVQGDMAKLDKESDMARTIETEALTEGLGPKDEML